MKQEEEKLVQKNKVIQLEFDKVYKEKENLAKENGVYLPHDPTFEFQYLFSEQAQVNRLLNSLHISSELHSSFELHNSPKLFLGSKRIAFI